MIKRIGLSPLYQWELDRQISVENVEFDEIHFYNKTMEKALVTEPFSNIVNIPNILLQSSENIYVFVMKDEKVVEHTSFGVCPRKQPEDYIYTETEHFTYKNIEARVKKLEENQNAGSIGDGGITTEKIADNAITEEKLSEDIQNLIEALIGATHTHENKLALDGLTGEQIDKWNKDMTDVFIVDDAAIKLSYNIKITPNIKEIVMDTVMFTHIFLPSPEDIWNYWSCILNYTSISANTDINGFDITGAGGEIIMSNENLLSLRGKSINFIYKNGNWEWFEVDPITRLPIDEELNALAEELHTIVTGGDTNE